MLDRASVIDQNFLIALKTAKFPNKVSNIQAGVTQLSPQEFVQLFESQIISRHLDLRARILKDQGIGFIPLAVVAMKETLHWERSFVIRIWPFYTIAQEP